MKKIIFIITFFLFGCSNEETITFGFESSVAADIAIEMIEKESIWYKKKSNGKYEFIKNDLPRIQAIYGDATNQIIPFGRSSSYGPKMFNLMVARLKSEGIQFKVNNYLGDNWVIWEEADLNKVKRIENEAKEEVINSRLK